MSQRTRDVHVACYLGRECALVDYGGLVVHRIKEFQVSSSAALALAASKDPKSAQGAAAASGIRLRGVKVEPYLAKEEEKESYKVLHQLEFNSFREQA